MNRTVMAQAIITELYQKDEIVPAADPRVMRKARQSYITLECEYQMALRAANSVGRTIIT